jgi:DNA-binding LytR/AlgR family response regulator
MIRCLIIDDEQIAQQILEQYILQAQGLALVAKCRNALDAFAKLEQHQIDLIFLDIEMPLVNGISFLKTLPHPPKVILTTAYADYALQGYEMNVVDYLLKPFSLERFLKAVAKVNLPEKPAVRAAEAGHLMIKENGGLVKIPYDKIRYIEASRDYVKILTADHQFLVHLTMKSLEEQLPSALFVRIHKSYIVSLTQVKMIKVDSIVIGNDQSLPLSTHYKENLVEIFRK